MNSEEFLDWLAEATNTNKIEWEADHYNNDTVYSFRTVKYLYLLHWPDFRVTDLQNHLADVVEVWFESKNLRLQKAVVEQQARIAARESESRVSLECDLFAEKLFKDANNGYS